MDETKARTHDLKCWPDFFERLLSGEKTFEVRKDDRGFRAGDTLLLREWDRWAQQYTGREMRREASYLMSGPAFGIEPGYVVMALAPAPSQPTSEARVELEAVVRRLLPFVETSADLLEDEAEPDEIEEARDAIAEARAALARRAAPTPGYREGWEAGREAAAAWHDIQVKAIDNVARCASDNAAYLGSADYQKIARHGAAAAAIRALPLPESALLTKAARCGECGRDVLLAAATAGTDWCRHCDHQRSVHIGGLVCTGVTGEHLDRACECKAFVEAAPVPVETREPLTKENEK